MGLGVSPVGCTSTMCDIRKISLTHLGWCCWISEEICIMVANLRAQQVQPQDVSFRMLSPQQTFFCSCDNGLLCASKHHEATGFI